MPRSTPLARLLAIVLLSTALLLAAAGPAFAAVGEPTLGFSALKARLEASPDGVSGHLKTVVKGATIEEIELTVLAVTGDTLADSLIMFRSDTMATAYGGIVSGMSGSPVYIQDGGVWKVIGALSYGDLFTRSGFGLATPIESMLRLQTDYAPSVRMLKAPVTAGGRTIDRIVISDDPASIQKVSPDSVLIASPLSSVFIGGLPPASPGYKKLAASLEKRGLSVMALEAPLSAGTSTFTTDVVPGSALAVLATRGDVWIGGIGTTTFVDGDTVLAFGHPAFYVGATSLYLCNTWVSGVWPSDYLPYKIAYPTAVRGTITQDRNAGILGAVGAPPAEAPVTATVTDGARAASSTVFVSSELQDAGQLIGLAGAAAYGAAIDLFDAAYTPGSADTTSTIRLAVGSTQYTVTMAGVMDSASDMPSLLGSDADGAVSLIQSVLGEGIERPHIISVDVQAAMTTARRTARIVGVSLDEPLHEGDNTVNVSLLAYGLAATRTVGATLTVPPGTALSGAVLAGVPDRPWGSPVTEVPAPPSPRQSVAQIVDRLNAAPPANAFTVTLLSGDPFAADPATSEAASVTVVVPWVMSGASATAITQITADVSPRTVPYRGAAEVTGMITGPVRPVMVSVYGTPVGSAVPTLLAQKLATSEDGFLVFDIMLGGLTTNTSLSVSVDGGPDYTPGTATTSVGVRAAIRLTSSKLAVRFGRHVTLTARVSPARARGRVTFQYWEAAHKHWRAIGTRYLHAAGTYAHAQIDWMPAWGVRRVRAVYAGDRYNVGVTSAQLTTRAR